jgi:Co/Zn/Cd efflux system component
MFGETIAMFKQMGWSILGDHMPQTAQIDVNLKDLRAAPQSVYEASAQLQYTDSDHEFCMTLHDFFDDGIENARKDYEQIARGLFSENHLQHMQIQAKKMQHDGWAS